MWFQKTSWHDWPPGELWKISLGCLCSEATGSRSLLWLWESLWDNLAIAFCTSPVSTMHTEANESPLEERRLKLSMHYYLKTHACTDNPAHHTLHEFDPTIRDLYILRPNGRGGMTRPSTQPIGLKLEETMASHSMSCLQAIEGEDTENPLICHIMNLLWALSGRGTCVRFCWVPSHCGIEGNEVVDQLAKETLDHDINPLTTVHYADVKPLVNLHQTGSSNQMGCIYTW